MDMEREFQRARAARAAAEQLNASALDGAATSVAMSLEVAATRADSDQLLAEAHQQIEALRKQVENLQIALRSARCIGAAIGILMATEKVDQEQAFDTLVRLSQASHRKLRDIAEEVVLTGALPAA
jgi:AmiR/NasT family two-component response regulator